MVWLALGFVAAGIVAVIAAVLLLAGRARELRHQQYRLGKRVKQVQELSTAIEGVTQRAAEMEQSVQLMQKNTEALQARMKPADGATKLS